MEAFCSERWIQTQVDRSIEAWRVCADSSMPQLEQFEFHEQSSRESAYDDAQEGVERELKLSPHTRQQRAETQNRIIDAFARFSATALNLEPAAVDLLTNDFLPMGRQLAHWANRFDPALSKPDMIQACRNAWTVCGLQQLLGVPSRITPSIVGYSLLYPYTDNYLDRPDLSGNDKLRFSERFRHRLRGDGLSAANQREVTLWTMVRLIEDEYPRTRYPQVFECLLAIHNAQEESLAQLKSRSPCSDAEIMRISCAKGGTSVLADASLVHGSLTQEESQFAFDWGVALQLGDDLQDVREDMKRGSVTLFTRAASANTPLDALAIQLLNFSDRVADSMNQFTAATPLKRLLRMSWISLIRMAVADAHEFFSPGFLSALERSSPFTFRFLRARNKELARRRGLYSKLFDVLVEDCEDDALRAPFPDYRLSDGMALCHDSLTGDL
jgi:hypothetical protein